MKHVCNFSFGIGSWAAAKLVVAKYGVDDTILLFADTLYEDDDTYAWGEAAAKNVGAQLVRICDGRNPWQVFRDERYLGNSRVDPCSKILKRQLCDRWMKDNFTPNVDAEVTCYFGIHWSEQDRFRRWDKETNTWKGIQPRMAQIGWNTKAPLCEAPLLAYDDLGEWAKREGLWNQNLYALGFPHANCGGRCVKQGQSGWALLLRTMPERFLECERQEEDFRQFIGKDVTMMSEVVNGKKRTLPLKVLRERIERKEEMPLFDFGACSCFAGDE